MQRCGGGTGKGREPSNVGLTGLGLSDQVPSKHGGLDGPLLDSGGLLETVGVDSPEEILGEAHGVEGLNCLIPVGLDVGVRDATEASLGGRGGTPPGGPRIGGGSAGVEE